MPTCPLSSNDGRSIFYRNVVGQFRPQRADNAAEHHPGGDVVEGRVNVPGASSTGRNTFSRSHASTSAAVGSRSSPIAAPRFIDVSMLCLCVGVMPSIRQFSSRLFRRCSRRQTLSGYNVFEDRQSAPAESDSGVEMERREEESQSGCSPRANANRRQSSPTTYHLLLAGVGITM